MTGHILVTGASGLVGTALCKALKMAGNECIGLDLRDSADLCGNVCNSEDLSAALNGCEGIIHLAAVSRVVWGEQDPTLCHQTNVEGTRTVIKEALSQKEPPWMIFSSSREVYGQQLNLPVKEDVPLAPMNVYARSKVAGEQLVAEARQCGLQGSVLRLSNVYGCVNDHVDRVVPAFARGAVNGETLRVDGGNHTFDFTHLEDTVIGLIKMVELLRVERTAPPPLHLLTGCQTTLHELACLAVEVAGNSSKILEAPPRSYDVSHFSGDPGRAKEILGWESTISIREGMARLVKNFRELEVKAELEQAS